jgi:inorganic pyrophosphatase
MNEKFWTLLEKLVQANGVTIDRAKGSPHPRYPDYIYPLDYGFINGTKSSDGAEIDVWVGSSTGRRVTGVLTTLDPLKKDVEIKVLVDCTPDEMQLALAASNRGAMGAVLLAR